MFTQPLGRTRFVIAGVLVGLGSLGAVFLASGSTSTTISYLKAKTANPWSTMALAAAGESPDTAYLSSTPTSSATDIETAILAYTAKGLDPRTAHPEDPIAKLKTTATGGQLGDATLLNDDIFGILALTSAGVPTSDTTLTNSIQFLKAHQAANGGFGYAVSGSPDTNMTAAAIMALRAVNTPTTDTTLTQARAYLASAQNTDGGFPYDPTSTYGTDSDASSDAWVLMALTALGEPGNALTKNGKDARTHLDSLLADTGFYRFQAGSAEDAFSGVTTAYALIATSGKTLPVHSLTSSIPLAPEVSYRIEGKDAQICQGSVRAHDALELVKIVAPLCGTTYHIKELSFGPYLDAIGSDAASGMIGWMYLVNNEAPSVGANEYLLKTGDAVLWYYGDYGITPLQLTASEETVPSGSPITLTTSAYSNGSWSPASGVTITTSTGSVTTTANGTISVTLPDGTYRYSATKTGAIRSNIVEVTVGTPSGTAIPLSVTIPGGGNTGDTGTVSPTPGTLSFSVETEGNSLGFGAVGPGNSASKTVTLTNSGAQSITIRSTVTGDSLFRSAITLDGVFWRTFFRSIAAGAHESAKVALTIPNSVTSGTKSGTLVFWATPQ